jgi:ribosomal protein S18 acetylase RimI-like enzyme
MQSSAVLRLAPLSPEYMDDVLRIHELGLDYTINTLLGRRHLATVYETADRDPRSYVRVALSDGKPVGVISGTLNEGAVLRKLAKTLGLWRILVLAARVFAHPRWFVHAVRSVVISAPLYWNGKVISAVLTSIVVERSQRGRGVGRTLVSDLESFFVASGVDCYRLDTLVSNNRAQHFYEELGFDLAGRRAGSYLYVRQLSTD